MLQMKFEPNWASGYNLILKELLFESVDRQQKIIDLWSLAGEGRCSEKRAKRDKVSNQNHPKYHQHIS